MSGKRKRVVLSMRDKLNILQQLNKGASGVNLAKQYGVGTSTISDIKKNSESLLKFTTTLDSEEGSKHRKTMKTAENKDLEKAMYVWFIQKRSQGQPISGPLLCEKAMQMNAQIGGSLEFKASTGWLKRFKSRHGIRELEIQGEKLSADVPAANAFKEKVSAIIKDGYTRNNIYNADETGLNWKSLPSKSLASRREIAAPGYKSCKQRVTIMTCANSSGTHRLPLLMIGKAKTPRCFKTVKNLPLNYQNQKMPGWMLHFLLIGMIMSSYLKLKSNKKFPGSQVKYFSY